ncbi:MAG: glycosyltransferase family 2 protein [Anaerolineae bacterium]
MQLAVIILNWNAAADTIECVRRFSGWNQAQPVIWVVDNASGDSSAEAIARECPQVHLLRNSTNLGYAGGNNRAIVEALAAGDAPLLLLNNDAHIAETDVMTMLDTLAARPEVGIVGPLMFDGDRPDKLLAAGGQNIVWHLTSHLAGPPADEPVYPVDYIPGTVMLVRAEVFRRVGLLDEAYFFTGETPDFCYRAKLQGYLSVVETRARASHTISRSKLRGTLYVYYIVRNRFLFLRKHYRRQFWLFGFWALYCLALTVKLQLSGQSPTAKATWLGLADGWQGRFGGQNERVLAACSGQPPPVLQAGQSGQRS